MVSNEEAVLGPVATENQDPLVDELCASLFDSSMEARRTVLVSCGELIFQCALTTSDRRLRKLNASLSNGKVPPGEALRQLYDLVGSEAVSSAAMELTFPTPDVLSPRASPRFASLRAVSWSQRASPRGTSVTVHACRSLSSSTWVCKVKSFFALRAKI